jgi:quercetin dioxygenase-like cupin family protein
MPYVKARDVAAVEHEPGLFALKLIDGSRGARGVSLLRGWLEPGARHSLHTHDMEEVVVFLSGRGVVSMDGEQFEVGSGDAILIPAGVPHSTWNPAPDEPVHFVAAFSDSVISSRSVAGAGAPTTSPARRALLLWHQLRWAFRRLRHAARPLDGRQR